MNIANVFDHTASCVAYKGTVHEATLKEAQLVGVHVMQVQFSVVGQSEMADGTEEGSLRVGGNVIIESISVERLKGD